MQGIFLKDPCIYGQKPKDIVPLINGISKRKSWKVSRATIWLGKVLLGEIFLLGLGVWVNLQYVLLDDNVDDDISLMLTSKG